MFERILVTLDGSKPAEIVIPYVEEIAAKFSSDITLANVYESRAADEESIGNYLEQMTDQVQRQLQDFSATKETTVANTVLHGKPADEILRHANEHDIRLIAIASHGASTRGPWALGAIAAKVLRATGRPILLVRVIATDIALQQRKLIKKILLPLDGSEIGEAAIPYAEALAEAFNAELILFQYVMMPAAETMGSVAIIDHENAVKASAINYLDNMAARLKEKGLSTSVALDEGFGSAANHIIEYAKTNDIDLIAMSTHGRSGIGRWVFGNITDKVLHTGNTPVLAVRATGA